MTHLNYKAYEKVENLNKFSPNSFNNYCNRKIKECSNHIYFLKKKILSKPKKLNVCEIGSGSGKLLFRLEKEKMINTGIGYETSKSRCKFAKRFKKYMKSKNVIIKNKNFINSNLTKQRFDLIIGIDVVFNLVSAISFAQGIKLLDISYQALKKGGFLILEIASFNEIINKIKNNRNYKKTYFFNKADPFKSVDHTYELKKNNNLLIKKKFYSRKGTLDYFDNLLMPIEKSFWKNMKFSKKNNLRKWNLKIYNYWKNKTDTSEKEYIVVLQKK